MMKKRSVNLILAAAGMLATAGRAHGSGHGPVFGLATPTNPRGGFSFDTSVMGRYGDGSGAMFRATLGYGVTENFKVAVSAPLLFQAEPLAPARVAPFTPMGGDFEALAIWRFHRQDTGVGSRFETAAIGGLLAPGPQDAAGALKGLHSGPGAVAGLVSGIASRSHYAWAGATYQRYAESDRDRRPDLFFYSAVYAYRPPSWRTDTGWDWRVFGELIGEKAGHIQRAGLALPDSGSHQVFVGPTALGVYKNYAVSAGVQFPLYQDVNRLYYPRERFRLALNFSYFF